MVKSKSEDLIGKKFNMLTVNKFVGKINLENIYTNVPVIVEINMLL